MSTPLPVAFYLPQFHTIPENDAWWEAGFTEWTLVERARPLFDGHRQPVVPAPPLGAYHLLDREVRRQQAELARAHGIHAFCYYHYWFRGKRLLHEPLERLLLDGEPDLPFMLCWANETWSRRWHGLEEDVLQLQDYGDEDDWDAHLEVLLRFFDHPRYVRVQGKPVLLLYRASHIPRLDAMLAHWRKRVLKAGHAGLYSIAALGSFGAEHAIPQAVDAAYEFLPGFAAGRGLAPVHLQGVRTVAAEQAWQIALRTSRLHPVQYPGAFHAWDNTPRCASKGLVYLGLRPERFRQLLGHQLQRALHDSHLAAPFVFINAWNEWSEGCHLEPDLDGGTLFLEAVRNAVEDATRTTPDYRAEQSVAETEAGADVPAATLATSPAHQPAPANPVMNPSNAPGSTPWRITVGKPGTAREINGLGLRCEPMDPLLGEFAPTAAQLRLETLEPELLDLMAIRQRAGLPSELDHKAILSEATGPLGRIRTDLLRLALPLCEVSLQRPATSKHGFPDDPTRSPGLPILRLEAPGEPGAASQTLQALALKSPTARIQALLPLAERWPERVDLRVHVARACLDLGQLEDAARMLRIALASHPRDSGAQAELGRMLFMSKQGNALQVLTDVLSHSPWQLRGWQYLLRLLALQTYPEASNWAQRAVDTHPHNYAIGLLAVRIASPAIAVELLWKILDGIEALLEPEELTTVVPALSATCADLPTACWTLDRGRTWLMRATEKFPMSVRLADLRGYILRESGETEAAHQEHARAARLHRASRMG